MSTAKITVSSDICLQKAANKKIPGEDGFSGDQKIQCLSLSDLCIIIDSGCSRLHALIVIIQ